MESKYLKLKLKVGEDEIIRILEANRYILSIAGSNVRILSEDGTIVDQVTLPANLGETKIELVPKEDRFVFKVDKEILDSAEVGDLKIAAEPVTDAEAEIVSGVTGTTAIVSEAASEGASEINKFVKLSEDIARATTDSIKIQLESLHRSGTVAKPVVLPATAYTKMFMLLSKLNITTESTREDVIKEITTNITEFEDVVKTIAREAETLEKDVWVKLEKETVDLRRILKMLDSKVVVDIMKDVAVEARTALSSNDPERIMKAYARTVRLVGLIAPGIIGERPEEYYSRIDKILLEGETPRSRLEHIIKKVFEPAIKPKEQATTVETEEHRKVAESVGA